VPAAGVSTLDALEAGAPGGLPVIDARRREVFVPGQVLAPGDVDVEPGRLCVGSGAVRYREALEAKGALIPPDGDERHLARARFHAALARDFGPADEVEPLYLRLPDADKTRP
jgi:tRNA A37 threonylcarbamoyladenosine modification protein TsaB